MRGWRPRRRSRPRSPPPPPPTTPAASRRRKLSATPSPSPSPPEPLFVPARWNGSTARRPPPRRDVDAGHAAVGERRLEDIEETRRGRADEHDPIAEERGIDRRLPVVEDFLLRGHEIEEGMGLVGPALQIVGERRATEVDQRPLVALGAAGGADAAPLERHPPIADDET